MHVCICVFIYECVCVFISMYVCMYVCMYMYACMCVQEYGGGRDSTHSRAKPALLRTPRRSCFGFGVPAALNQIAWNHAKGLLLAPWKNWLYFLSAAVSRYTAEKGASGESRTLRDSYCTEKDF